MKKIGLYTKLFFQAIYLLICESSLSSTGRSIYSKKQRMNDYYEAKDALLKTKDKIQGNSRQR